MRSRAGPCRRASRCAAASGIWRCTSRTIRSSTPTSKGRSPPGSTGRGRSRSGTAVPTTCSRRSETAVSPCGSTASGSTARWTLVPRGSTAIRRTGSSCARTRRGKRRPPLCADARVRCRVAPARAGLGVRAEMARLPRCSSPSLAVGHSTSRNGNDLTERFAPAARAAKRRPPHGGRRARRGDLRTRRAGRLALRPPPARLGNARPRPLRRARDRPSESLVDFSLVERRRRLEDVVDPSVGGVVVSPRFEDGQALLAAASEEGLEGVVAKRKDSAYPLRETWHRVAEGEGARAPGGRRRRLHTWAGAAELRLRRAGRSAFTRRAGSGGRGTSAPASPTGRSTACLKLMRPLQRQGLAVRAGAENAESPPRRRRLGRAEAGGRGRVRRVDARGTAARPRVRRAA